jgi:hypothetical protein
MVEHTGIDLAYAPPTVTFRHVTFPPPLVTAKVVKAAISQTFALLLEFTKSDNKTPLELYLESGKILAIGDGFLGMAAFLIFPESPVFRIRSDWNRLRF